MKYRLLPYKLGSKSAKDLARALGFLQLKPNGTFRPRDSSQFVIINYGSSRIDPRFPNARYINPPEKVALSSNKLTALTRLKEVGTVNIPEFTTELAEAVSWCYGGRTGDSSVVCRKLLTGHSGRGIEIVKAVAEYDTLYVPSAPLYTKYIKKTHEYRVHVFPDNSTWVAQKKRRLEVPDDQVNWSVRNHANGFIYSTQELGALPSDLVEQAVKAKMALGLDFCAVDVIYNQYQNKSYVLEANAAPGLSGITLETYVHKFKQYLNLN